MNDSKKMQIYEMALKRIQDESERPEIVDWCGFSQHLQLTAFEALEEVKNG